MCFLLTVRINCLYDGTLFRLVSSDVDVLQSFNKRLTEEPEHYDLFKTSFTK